jgi:hypothetical protein
MVFFLFEIFFGFCRYFSVKISKPLILSQFTQQHCFAFPKNFKRWRDSNPDMKFFLTFTVDAQAFLDPGSLGEPKEASSSLSEKETTNFYFRENAHIYFGTSMYTLLRSWLDFFYVA